MRVLLDEHLPLDFAKDLAGHDASTVRAQGWPGLKNGELLTTAAAAGFDVLLANDRGIEHQQSLAGLTIGVVVLDSPSNRLRELRARLAPTLEAIAAAVPGSTTTLLGNSRVQRTPLRATRGRSFARRYTH